MADSGVAESLLQRLDQADGGVDSQQAAASLGVDHQLVVGAVKSLQALGEVICAELRSSKHWEVTEEGKEIAEKGSHEARVFSCIPAEGMAQSQLMTLPSGKVGFSKAMSNKWIKLDKTAEGGPRIYKSVDSIEDTVKDRLQLVQRGQAGSLEEKEKNELKKRKLLSEVTVKSYWITKGCSFSTTVTKQETELTPEMLASGAWRDKKFKPYNFDALGIIPDCGHLHPLMKVRTQFRQIFLEMGFTEMPTNNFIESSFWNFDALFQPQQHPARDQHDTFFLSERTGIVTGDQKTYKYDWKIEEAQKNILRTHTTAVSARMLYRLAQQEEFTPVKYFSIDRVFRNETLDATHLAEFHQVEGVVADYGLTLGDLMGILHQFFIKLVHHLNTGPLIQCIDHVTCHWDEAGGMTLCSSGRSIPLRELLETEVLPVCWLAQRRAGELSLFLPTMIKYGINNIRELVGHKVNLQMVYDSPVCRLDS
ncbi:UNVERIFIED_CONTAM: hypothetical protein FKN15_067796 [Acipenser sinensis]